MNVLVKALLSAAESNPALFLTILQDILDMLKNEPSLLTTLINELKPNEVKS